MAWTWTALVLPPLPGRLWPCLRRRRRPLLDPRSLSAHWRRDLGFGNEPPIRE
jgi:hypothetical protein